MANISIPVILEFLSEYEPEFFGLESEMTFHSVFLYESGQLPLCRENLYICYSSALDDNALKSDCCFLCINQMPPGFREQCRGKQIIALSGNNLTLAGVCNYVQKLFDSLYMVTSAQK